MNGVNLNKLDSSLTNTQNINVNRQKKPLTVPQQPNEHSIEGKDYVREQGFATYIDKSAHDLAIRPEIIVDNLLQDVNGIDVDNKKEDYIYILLQPFNRYLTINKKNGNIENDILSIPKPFRQILHFNTKALSQEKKIYKLYEVSYWMVYKSRTFHIMPGKRSVRKF